MANQKHLPLVKSAGWGSIYTYIMQHEFEEIAETLYALLRTSLITEYVLSSWRKVKMVFIPKPGRGSNIQDKSFRPISLLSILVKTEK